MNVLLLSARFPWPPFTGDRLRAAIWISALAETANVTLVAPQGVVPGSAPRIRFHAARPSFACTASGAMRVLAGAPMQSLLAARYDWRDAMRRAEQEAGRFDVTIVLLSRLDACVRAYLPRGFRILDAIDSLQLSMSERANETAPLARWFWRAEAKRVAKIERDATPHYDRVVVVSEEDAAALNAIVVPNGVAIQPLLSAPRRYDFAFWGRLPYFANADAARWLLDEIWPAIRARKPDATLLLGGADAPAHILAAHGRDGITVQSPIRDVAALARDVRVALFPIRFGTGQSNKVLEAAEGGCAIVATPKAMRGLDALHGLAAVANDTESLAAAAVAALGHRTAGAALRHAVETHYARQQTSEELLSLIRRTDAAA